VHRFLEKYQSAALRVDFMAGHVVHFCQKIFSAARWTVMSLAMCSAAGCLSGAGGAADPAYPKRTIVILCPWAPGGGSDRVARFLADQLQHELGVPVVVVNQTGGRGFLGHAAGARARPDGYTLTLATFELCTFQAMGIADLSWRELVPLAQVNGDPAAILVRTDAPWNTLGELLEEAKAQPGKLTMSGTAAGAAWDLARAGLLLAVGLPADAIRWVPSQGAAPALVELLGGHVDTVCCSVAEAKTLIEAGQLRGLAVMGPQRLPEVPKTPTLHELGIDWEVVGWRGLMLPRDTPPAIQRRLAQCLEKIVASPAYRQFMQENGFGIVVRLGEAFGAFLAAEEAKWRDVIERVGYRQTEAAAHDPGPWLVPRLCGGVLAFGTLVLAASAWLRRRALGRERGPGQVGPPDRALGSAPLAWKPALGLTAGLIGYGLAMHWLGYFIPTSLFAWGTMVWLRLRWTTALAATVVLVGLIWVLFGQVFHVALPRGAWLGLP
jgi:tripartite-type tricarboxylate transporter receptor subunit TctC